jgi:pyruvate dehydrogenase (quinone)
VPRRALELAARLKAPVGFALRGKQRLEHGNPYAVGLTGLLGYGGRLWSHQPCRSTSDARDRFSVFGIPSRSAVRKVQIDQNPKHIGRRTSLNLGLVGDVKATLQALLENVQEKSNDRFLRKYVAETESFAELKQHYVTKGPGIKPIRPKYLAATLSNLASDDAMFFADTGTAVIWLARHINGVIHILLNNGSLDFVSIEQQEAGYISYGVGFKNPNFAAVAEAMGAKGFELRSLTRSAMV